MEKINPAATVERITHHSPTNSTTIHGSTAMGNRDYVRAINSLVKIFGITWGYYLRGRSDDDVRLAKRLWARDLVRYADRPEAILAGVELARQRCREVPSPAELVRLIRDASGEPATPAHRVVPHQARIEYQPRPEVVEEHRAAMRALGFRL